MSVEYFILKSDWVVSMSADQSFFVEGNASYDLRGSSSISM